MCFDEGNGQGVKEEETHMWGGGLWRERKGGKEEEPERSLRGKNLKGNRVWAKQFFWSVI